jgi:hypothetical protein
MVLLIIWALFMVSGALMADARGRSVVLGALAGFFFGIFAIIYYFIVGDSEEKRNDKMIETIRKIKGE